MTRGAVTALSVLALANLLVGWIAGFHALADYVAFWLLCASVGVAGVQVARRLFRWTGHLDATLRAAVVSFAFVVLAGFVLGTAGLIGTAPYLVLGLAGLAASMALPRPQAIPAGESAVPVHLIAVVLPILAFVVAVGLTQSPLTLYDSLSYHLFFPARWLQEHRLSIIPTPFSDAAQAYAPANGELFFLWLMTPFHGDLIARIGQLPFYLLCGAALYALARRIGASAGHAAYVPAFYFLSRPIVEQAVGADVDLICWAMFLTSVYFGFIAVESDETRDWALWGISVGLYLGSKYVSLVYAPVLLVLPLVGGLRRRALWAVPGILVFAAPWYLRNWLIAGSPIYPSSVTIGGLTIAQGAYSRAAMMHSVFHTTDPRLLPVMLSHAFGTPLILFWVSFAVIGAWSMRTARPRREAVFLLLAPVIMIPLYWFGVPDNVDSRFLLPMAMLALLPLAFAFRAHRVWNAAVHVAFAAGLLWLVVGWRGELPVRLPWFMGGWLALDGIVARPAVPLFCGLALVVSVAASVASRRLRLTARALVLALAVGASILSAGVTLWCARDHGSLLTISPTYIRATMLDGWRWVDEHVGQSTIAYTGNNVPYPLAGPHLTNRVVYVNIDRHRDWRLHDYDRAHRGRRDDSPAIAPLAVSSGVLMPLPGPPRWHVDAVRPRYERLQGDRAAWTANLKSLGVDRVFVSALSAYEIDYVTHNEGGFPVEDEWARTDPSTFTLLYENAQVRLYAVHAP